VADSLRTLDGLGDAGYDPVAPAAGLVAEETESPGGARPERTFCDDASPLAGTGGGFGDCDTLERRLGANNEGPVWGLESDDLNATLLAWGSGRGTAEHVNTERDVLIFVADRSAVVTIDADAQELQPGSAVIIPKGRRRSVLAGPRGVRYLSVHIRRPPLQIRPAPTATEA